MDLDDIDFNIIRELQADGRRPLREVARNLGIAEATVRMRLKRLLDEEVLQIIAFADPMKLGQSQMALIFVTTTPGMHDHAVKELQSWSDVSYLSTTLGDADICVQVVCADQAALWEIRQRVRAIKGVIAVQLLNEVQVHKIRFALPAGTG